MKQTCVERGLKAVRGGLGSLLVSLTVIFPVLAAKAAGDVETVLIRGGREGNMERVVFDWPIDVNYELSDQGTELSIRFDQPARFDLSGLGTHLGERIRSVRVADAEPSRAIILDLAPGSAVLTHTLPNRKITVDVSPPSAAGDAAAAELEQRVEALEQAVILLLDDLEIDAPAEAEEPTPPPPAKPPAQADDDSAPPPEPGAQVAAPGQFEVDEEDIDRALDRTLVQAGALLLQAGWVEIAPRFSYVRSELDAPLLFIDGDPSFVAEGSIRRDEWRSVLGIRAGLPFDAQLEFDLPYRYVDQSTVIVVNGAAAEVNDDGAGLGDIRVALAKTILREGRWHPDLVGRIAWDTDSGENSDDGVVLDASVNEIIGSLSAVKRQDPLAFIGSLSYKTALEQRDVDLGDAFGLSLGAVLAASPETSLRLVLDQNFVQETAVDGDDVPGSDLVVGALTIGASSIIGLGTSLDLATDIGITDDAPDYAVTLAVTTRFNAANRLGLIKDQP